MKRFCIMLASLCAVGLFFSNSYSQLDPVALLNSQLKKYKINFHLNEYEFTDPKYIKQMDKYAPLIKAITDKIPAGYVMLVQGHASQDGPEEYNQELSSKRADTVYERLKKAGVSGNIMKPVGKGEALNRRVVNFKIVKD